MSATVNIAAAALLLAHPAPLDAQSGQASDGPVLVTPQPASTAIHDKAVFLRPTVSPTGGMALPARLGARLFACYEHPAHPAACRNAKGGFHFKQEA